MSDDAIAREWVANGGEVFKQSFTLGKWHHHQIAGSPDCELIAGAHREIKSPGLGKMHLDSYAASRPPLRLFARLYHVSTGQFRWYRIKEIDAGGTPKEERNG